MKKKIIVIVIMLIIIGTATFLLLPKDNSDNKRFKNAYGNTIPKDTSIIYLTDDNIVESLSTQDMLIFIGSPASDNTKKAVPTLLKAAEDNGIDKIYYYDATSIKEEINKVLTEKLNKEEILLPTLFLLKDKKISELEEGLNKDIEAKYEDIMIAYIMCNTPNC